MATPDSALTDWLASFAAAHGLDEAARAAILASARLLRLPAGARVFEPGLECRGFIVVAIGSVRVHLTAESGREIVLYRVGAGQSCVLTTSCLLQNEVYGASAICETEVAAVFLPTATFKGLLDSSRAFREAVLAAYAARVSELVLTLEETAFRRLDARLAQALLSRASAGRIAATHQDLAGELGSAREAVSRLLKRFEREGLVRLARGAIEVNDASRLGALAREG